MIFSVLTKEKTLQELLKIEATEVVMSSGFILDDTTVILWLQPHFEEPYIGLSEVHFIVGGSCEYQKLPPTKALRILKILKNEWEKMIPFVELNKVFARPYKYDDHFHKRCRMFRLIGFHHISNDTLIYGEDKEENKQEEQEYYDYDCDYDSFE
jgi:hypothetical protein